MSDAAEPDPHHDLPELWWEEEQTPNLRIGLRVKEILEMRKTAFQALEVLDTYEVGRLLILDGAIMFSSRDEFFYHEMIAHTPLMVLPETDVRVLIIGGGDYGAARECLKHDSVVRVRVCDIDAEVTRATREHFPRMLRRPDGSSIEDDPRLELRFEDGIDSVRRTAESGSEKYTLAIVDSTDPCGPGTVLFTREFYGALKGCLDDDGMVIVQGGSPLFQEDVFSRTYRELKCLFGSARPVLTFAPLYPGGLWCLMTAGFDATLDEERYPKVKKRWERMMASGVPFRYYTPEIHMAACCAPGFVRDLLKRYDEELAIASHE
jgi:spermidine synthase